MIAGACMHSSSVDRSLALERGAPVKVFSAAGRIRIVSWSRDSVRVEGHTGRGEQFFWLGDARGVKLGVLQGVPGRLAQPSDFTIHVPATSSVAVKGARTDITADGVNGFFYTVSGEIRITGVTHDVQAEAVAGPIAFDGTAAWLRARTASGSISLTGSAQDAAAATVSGGVTVTLKNLARLEVETMSGSLTISPMFLPGALAHIDSHDGPVHVALDDSSYTRVEVERAMAGSMDQRRVITIGHGATPASLRVSTFSGTVDVRP